MTISGAVYREGVAYTPDGAVYVQHTDGATMASPIFTGTVQIGADAYVTRNAAGTLTLGTTAGAVNGSWQAGIYYIGSGSDGVYANSLLRLRGDTGLVGFASGNNATAAFDTAISRSAAGVVAVGTGAHNSKAGRVDLTTAGLQGVTFAALPSVPALGMVAVVTNSNTATWGATIAGGGANGVLAFYNGTNWTVAGA